MTYKYKTEEKIIHKFMVGIVCMLLLFFILNIIFSPVGRVVFGSFIFIIVSTYVLGWGVLSLHSFYKKSKTRRQLWVIK